MCKSAGFGRDPAFGEEGKFGGDQEDQLVTREMWGACKGDTEIPDGAEVYAAVQASYEQIPTVALAWCWRADDKRIVVRSKIWSGGDQEQLEQALALLDGYSLERLAFGPGPAVLEPLHQFEAAEVEAVYANSKQAREANRGLYGAITGERLIHNSDPDLTAHVVGVRGEWSRDEILDVYKRRQEQRADGWFAAALAVSLLPDAEDEILSEEDLIAAGW